MQKNQKIKPIGDSKFLRVPIEFIKVYKLDDYIYSCEVSKDGKVIMYTRAEKIDLPVKK